MAGLMTARQQPGRCRSHLDGYGRTAVITVLMTVVVISQATSIYASQIVTYMLAAAVVLATSNADYWRKRWRRDRKGPG